MRFYRDRSFSLAGVLVLNASLISAAPALAQPYPTKPVTVIVPFAPGGTAEIVGRAMAQEMQKFLGASVMVELKPGAGGNIGAELVAKQARPDGYTILLGSSSLASNPVLMKLNFDPTKDCAGGRYWHHTERTRRKPGLPLEVAHRADCRCEGKAGDAHLRLVRSWHQQPSIGRAL